MIGGGVLVLKQLSRNVSSTLNLFSMFLPPALGKNQTHDISCGKALIPEIKVFTDE